MKISLNWLKDFIKIPKNISPQKLGELLTLHTAEVEEMIDQGKQFEHMFIAKVLKINSHPNADKLKIAEVDLGKEKLEAVCGGNNLREGMLVPFAKVGAKIRWHGEGDLIVLEKAKIRGVESNGMICAGEEIGLPPAPVGGISDLSHLKAKPGMPLAEALGLNDVIFDIDNKSLTHRPDLWGHYGIARDLAVILGVKLKPYKSIANVGANGPPSPQNAGLRRAGRSSVQLSIAVQNPKLCPRYCGVLIDNIKIAESPEWLKTRLQAAGYRSICNIVDITNYVMAELGQPLHAFDKNFIKGGIIVRNAKEGELMKTLDGNEHKLTSEMLVIADHEKPVAIAGVMGGENSEINENTKTIIIESANFEPTNVRKTSVKLGLRTEAVQRFEKALDPNLAYQTILKTIELILKICPSAKAVSDIVDVKNFSDKNIQVDLSLERINSKIGKKIAPAKVKAILKALEFGVENGGTGEQADMRHATSEQNEHANKTDMRTKKGKTIKVSIPSFRATKDVNIEDDLVEEIARIYGYENIEPVLPDLPIKLPMENKERFLKHEAREILSFGLGLTEVYNYSFYSKEDFLKCGLAKEKHIKVQNYLSLDQTHMRLSLIPNLLKAIANNIKNFPEFKIYEIGRTYEEVGKYMPKEEKKISAAYVKNKDYNREIFAEAKEGLEAFLKRLKYPDYRLITTKTPPPYAHPEKCMDVFMRDKLIGNIFALHPVIAKNYDLKEKIGFFEVNFTVLSSIPQMEIKFKSLPKFPGLNFDVSVLVSEEKKVQELQDIIANSNKELIKEVELFDIYRGKNLPENKKALAFKILLQHAERTLSEQDLRESQQKIFENLQKAGGEIRGI